MSKQHCLMLNVEQFFRESRMLLRHCCRFGNNVERNFVILTKSKQIEHVQFVSTLSKTWNFTKNNSFDIVAKMPNKVERCFDIVAGVDEARNFTLSTVCLSTSSFRPWMRLRSIVTSMSVCMSVCPRGYIRNQARSLPILCMLPMAVARSSSGRVTNSQGEGAVWGIFLHWQSILQHSIWNPYKKAEPIEMPFVTISELGLRYSVLRGVRSRKVKDAVLRKTRARQT